MGTIETFEAMGTIWTMGTLGIVGTIGTMENGEKIKMGSRNLRTQQIWLFDVYKIWLLNVIINIWLLNANS